MPGRTKWAATGWTGGEDRGEKEDAEIGDDGESCADLPRDLLEVSVMVGSFDPHRFYGEVLEELERHALRGGTAFGFGTVLKRLALAYGLDVAERPLPRPTRAEREDLAWEAKQRSGRA